MIEPRARKLKQEIEQEQYVIRERSRIFEERLLRMKRMVARKRTLEV